MDLTNAFADLIVNIVAGFVGTLIVLWIIERRRRVVLRFSSPEPIERKSTNTIHLQINVCNKNMSPLLSWIYDREPALLCRAWLQFHTPDGQTAVYPDEMIGRWAETPEPFIYPRGGELPLIVPSWLQNQVDIPAGENVALDIVFKYTNEVECYGWNNDVYSHPGWRNPNWKLDKGRYIVEIRVKTEGREFTDIFWLINETDFRIEPVTDKRLRNKFGMK